VQTMVSEVSPFVASVVVVEVESQYWILSQLL